MNQTNTRKERKEPLQTDEQYKSEIIKMIAGNSDYLMQPAYEAVRALTGSGSDLDALKAVIIRDVLNIESEKTLSCVSSFVKALTGTGIKRGSAK